MNKIISQPKKPIPAINFAIYLALVAPSIKLLILPAQIYFLSGREFYLPILLHGLLDLVLLFVILYIKKKVNLSFVQMCESVLTKTGTKIVFALYAIYFLIKLTIPLIEQNLVAIDQLYESTKTSFFLIPLFFTIGFCAFKGGKSIFRASTFLSLFLGLAYLGLIFLSIFESNFSEIFPLFEFGFKPVAKGAFTSTLWFGDFIVLLFLFDFAKDKATSQKGYNPIYKIMIGQAFSIVLLLTFFLIILGIFGVTTPRQFYLLTKISKYSTAFSSIGRLDFLFFITVFLAMITHVCAITSILVDVLVYIFNVKRVALAVLACLTLFFLVLNLSPIFATLLLDYIVFYMPFVIFMQYIIPLFILIFCFFKHRKNLGGKLKKC